MRAGAEARRLVAEVCAPERIAQEREAVYDAARGSPGGHVNGGW